MVKLKLIELLSVEDPEETVVAVALLLDTLMTGVPVTVRFVVVALFTTVPVPLTVIFPVPNAMVLAVGPLPVKDPQVSVLPFRSRVPSTSVTPFRLLKVMASAKRQTALPPRKPKVIGKLYVTPPLVTILVPEVPVKVQALVPTA